MGCGASQPDQSVKNELKKLREDHESLQQQQVQLLDTVNALRTKLSEQEAKYQPSLHPVSSPPAGASEGHKERSRSAHFTDVPESGGRVQRKSTQFMGSQPKVGLPAPEPTAGLRASFADDTGGQEANSGINSGNNYSGIPVVEEEKQNVTFTNEQDEGGPRVRRKSTGFGADWKRQMSATESGLSAAGGSGPLSGISGTGVVSEAQEGQHAGFVPQSELPESHRLDRKKTGAAMKGAPVPEDEDEDEEGKRVSVETPEVEGGRVNRVKTGCTGDIKKQLAAAREAAAQEDEDGE
eukprot:Hpha_TRINITY_DN12420_c0_g2::TRINITY_DN12420_c0_g2_i2::g.42988::m.42988